MRTPARHQPVSGTGAWLTILAAACLAPLASPGRTADDEAELLPKDLGISLWDKSLNVRSGVGYKDNVLLSDAEVRSSAFFVNGFEAVALRLPLDGWEVRLMLSGDDYRYWHNVGVNHEDLWIGLAEVRRWFGDGWRVGGAFQYAYLNQVVDLFDFVNDIHQPPASVEGHTFTLRPSVRKELGSNWWAGIELEATRQFFTQPADSFDRFGPRLTLGHPYGRKSEWSVSYAVQEILYDHQSEVTADGTSIAGTSLRALKHELALASSHHWDAGRRWQSDTRLSWSAYHDQGAGFFDFYQYGLSEGLKYNGKTWQASGLAGLVYRDFPVQPVSSVDPSRLRQTRANFELRVEKTLWKTLKIFANYEREISLSDSPDEVYHVNTINAGLDWEF